jgi:hypothetical protein
MTVGTTATVEMQRTVPIGNRPAGEVEFQRCIHAAA